MLYEAGGAVFIKDWKIIYKETKQGFDSKSPI